MEEGIHKYITVRFQYVRVFCLRCNELNVEKKGCFGSCAHCITPETLGDVSDCQDELSDIKLSLDSKILCGRNF